MATNSITGLFQYRKRAFINNNLICWDFECEIGEGEMDVEVHSDDFHKLIFSQEENTSSIAEEPRIYKVRLQLDVTRKKAFFTLTITKLSLRNISPSTF